MQYYNALSFGSFASWNLEYVEYAEYFHDVSLSHYTDASHSRGVIFPVPCPSDSDSLFLSCLSLARPTFTMLLLGLLPLMLLRGCGCQAADVPEDVTAEFSVRLYHQLQITGGEENIIFSPLSVALALGMVELGARGSSLEEIRQALGYSHFREGTVNKI